MAHNWIYMHPLNRIEIRRHTLQFWLLFVVLLAATFVPAYAFVWASGQQHKAFIAGLQSHRQMLNKQILLHDKVDSLYGYIGMVNSQKVNNYLFLEKYISDVKNDITTVIGEDSSGRFNAYKHMMNTLNRQLLLKDSIVKAEARENLIKTDLVSCMAHTKGIRKDIFARTQLGTGK